MREQNFKVICVEPYVYCEVFDNNAGALELARLPKLRSRTKHINVCYHHFCKHMQKGLIKIFPLNTEDQIADALTKKALAQNDFQRNPAICAVGNLSKALSIGRKKIRVRTFQTSEVLQTTDIVHRQKKPWT
jgi:hypothetical protein